MSIRRAHSAFKEEVGLQLDNVGRQTTLARNWLGSGGRQRGEATTQFARISVYPPSRGLSSLLQRQRNTQDACICSSRFLHAQLSRMAPFRR